MIAFTLSSNTFAKVAVSDFSRAQNLWTDFRACESLVKDELALLSCIDGFISSTIPRYEKGKLASFLIMRFSFSELKSCDGIKDLLPTNPKKDEKYYCMDVLGNKSKTPGFITISTEKKQFKLKAIKY